jgi:hypothetical protein
VGINKLHVINGKASLPALPEHRIDEGRCHEEVWPGPVPITDAGEGVGEMGCLTTLFYGEVAVPGATGQTIDFAHRRTGLDLHRIPQIPKDTAEDDQLLPILLSQIEALRLDQGQETTDNRGHPFEVPGSGQATELTLQRGGGLHPGDPGVATGKKVGGPGGEQGVGPGAIGELGVKAEISRISMEILLGAELQRIDKHTDQDPAVPTVQSAAAPAGSGIDGPGATTPWWGRSAEEQRIVHGATEEAPRRCEANATEVDLLRQDPDWRMA